MRGSKSWAQSRALDRVDLDLDYAKQAAEWTEGALAKLAPPEDSASRRHRRACRFRRRSGSTADDDEPQFTDEHPLEAEISALVNLNGTGSTRETWHAEFAFDYACVHLSAGRRRRTSP